MFRLGEFPKSRHQAGIGRPLPQEEPVSKFNPEKRTVLVSALLRARLHGQIVLMAACPAQTNSANRTDEALRIFRQADSCTQLHQSLVVVTRVVAIEQRFSKRGETLFSERGSDVGCIVINTAQNA